VRCYNEQQCNVMMNNFYNIRSAISDPPPLLAGYKLLNTETRCFKMAGNGRMSNIGGGSELRSLNLTAPMNMNGSRLLGTPSMPPRPRAIRMPPQDPSDDELLKSLRILQRYQKMQLARQKPQLKKATSDPTSSANSPFQFTSVRLVYIKVALPLSSSLKLLEFLIQSFLYSTCLSAATRKH